MRLIDADALDKRIYNDVPISTFGSMRRMAAVRELIEEAPTVEPASPWRKVEDGLPEPHKKVMVNDDGTWRPMDYAPSILWDYWMPIEPLKEEGR